MTVPSITMTDTTHHDATHDHDEQGPQRYITTQYGHGDDEITLVHDTENDQAWLQSDAAVAVER